MIFAFLLNCSCLVCAWLCFDSLCARLRSAHFMHLYVAVTVVPDGMMNTQKIKSERERERESPCIGVGTDCETVIRFVILSIQQSASAVDINTHTRSKLTHACIHMHRKTVRHDIAVLYDNFLLLLCSIVVVVLMSLFAEWAARVCVWVLVRVWSHLVQQFNRMRVQSIAASIFNGIIRRKKKRSWHSRFIFGQKQSKW